MGLRIARKLAGLSQNDLARLSGVDKSQISRVENGKRDLCRYDMVLKVAAALHIEPDELLAIISVPDPRAPKDRIRMRSGPRHRKTRSIDRAASPAAAGRHDMP